jgi:plasmid stabilization system protein ParE
VTLKEINHWMTRITDAVVNTSTKLNQVADLDLGLGRKLDRLAAGLSANAEQKIDRLLDKVDKLADLPSSAQNKLDGAAKKIERMGEVSAAAEHRVDRLSDKIDKLADVPVSTNQKLDRVVEALLRREGQ